MKDLLTFLVKNITGKSDIGIEEKAENDRFDYIIKAPKEEMGLLIGKSGKTIRMIRNLIKVRATLEKKAVGVSIEELTQKD